MLEDSAWDKDAIDNDDSRGKYDDWRQNIKDAVLEGDAEETMRLVESALAEGIEADEIIKYALLESMSTVGRDFKNGEFYIPDVLMSSRASHAALFKLRRLSREADQQESRGTIVVGTVAGDLHDIGKNIASLLLRCESFTVIDLGIDVVPEAFAKAVREYHPQVLGLSALLTTTIGEMGKVIQSLERTGLRDQVKVYVSGLPVTQEFAEEIGADCYCRDARDTIEYVNSIMPRKES